MGYVDEINAKKQSLYEKYLTKNYTFKKGMKEELLEELMELFAEINQKRLREGNERYIEFEITEDGSCNFHDTNTLIYHNPVKRLGAKRLVDVYAYYKFDDEFVYV